MVRMKRKLWWLSQLDKVDGEDGEVVLSFCSCCQTYWIACVKNFRKS